MNLKPPLALPGTTAHRRLRSCLDSATNPNLEPAAIRSTNLTDVLGPAFRVRLKSRQFRASPKHFAFLQFGFSGQMLRFHPFGASAGEYEIRISKTSGLAYLTEPSSSRTWVSTLEPFRIARRAGRDASAIAIGAPFADLSTARWCAPRLVYVARWLKAQHRNLPAPSRDGQPLPVTLTGVVVAGLHIIDPVTGRQLVTLRSHSLSAGEAFLTVQKEALLLTQGGKVVYFPVIDLLARWGNQLTRSAIYTSAEDAQQRAAELDSHLALGRLLTQLLGSSREPPTDVLARLAAFSRVAPTVCSDRRRNISFAITLPRRLGGRRKFTFGLKDFGPHARFSPALCWMPNRDLLVLWTSAEGTVAAFGVCRDGVRRFGVFTSVEAARKAAALFPATLIREALVRKREAGSELSGRIARFNSFDVNLKADGGQVPVGDVFTATTIRFQTSSSRGLWSPKILLSPAGPLWVMYTKASVRRPVWLAYGPFANGAELLQPIAPSAAGRGRPSLESVADLLARQFSIRVTVASMEEGALAKLDDMHYILRQVVPNGFQDWQRKARDVQVRQFYDMAASLREALLSQDEARRREALVATEYFYFGKPTEQILNLHAPLFKPDSAAWSAVFREGGCADTRAKELVRNLGYFISERPKQGLPTTMHSRFSKFQGAMVQLSAAQAEAWSSALPVGAYTARS